MRYATFALLFLALLAPAAPALAKGTVTIQNADGTKHVYKNATLTVHGKTLWLTTADKKGTLIITDAACTNDENKLMRCLPYKAILQQNGTDALTISSGTIYYNPTSAPLTLKYSSSQVPPNGVIALFKTKAGTYVTVDGKLDGRG